MGRSVSPAKIIDIHKLHVIFANLHKGTDLHELLVVHLNPAVPIGVETGNTTASEILILVTNMLSYRWKASVRVFTTTHALTKRSKVIPVAEP
jgi:hypothetical protein